MQPSLYRIYSLLHVGHVRTSRRVSHASPDGTARPSIESTYSVNITARLYRMYGIAEVALTGQMVQAVRLFYYDRIRHTGRMYA